MDRAMTVLLMAVAVSMAACGGTTDRTSSEPPSTMPTLELLATIGCGACDGPEQITATGLDVDAERVVVFDHHEPLVRTFSLDGRSMAAFGERGQGPGEIQLPDFVPAFGFAGQGGRVLVYDMVGLQEYEGTGSFVALHRWAPSLPLATFYEGSQQRFYVLSMPPPWADSSGRRVSTLLAFDVAGEDFGPHVVLEQDEMPQDKDDPENRIVTTFAVAADGSMLLADARKYDLYWYSADGAPGATFGRDVPRPKLSPRRRQQIDAMRSQMGSTDDIDETTNHFAQNGLRFDSQGRLWVETLRWSEVGDERLTTTFDLFDGSDQYLGEVSLNVRLGSGGYTLVTLRGDLLAGAHLGPDGEWRVSVWRVVG